MKRIISLSVVALAAFLAPMALSTPSAQAPQAPNDSTTWAIDTNHSAANFAVKHMLVSTVRGTLGPMKGTVTWDGKSVASVKADVTIEVNGISTDNSGRDTHLKSADFFDAANHPTITFKSTRVQPGAGGAFTLVGDLAIRGTTREVTLDVEAPAAVIAQPGRNGGAPTYRTGTTATTTVNRFDYGLKWNSLIEAGGGAVVGAEVKVTLDLELTRR